MSVFPIGLRAESLTVLVIGGGQVGARKARAFLDAGAHVRVVAPSVQDELESAADPTLEVVTREFAESDLDGADLAIAATADPQLNARITAACRARRILCNRVDEPAEGTFDTLAVHRTGDLAIGVSAGGVPVAAMRIRDEIACRFDARYGDAVDRLAHLRQELRSAGRWSRASESLTGEDFCEAVESGLLQHRISEWD